MALEHPAKKYFSVFRQIAKYIYIYIWCIITNLELAHFLIIQIVNCILFGTYRTCRTYNLWFWFQFEETCRKMLCVIYYKILFAVFKFRYLIHSFCVDRTMDGLLVSYWNQNDLHVQPIFHWVFGLLVECTKRGMNLEM